MTFASVDAPADAQTLPAELQALGGNISYEVDTVLPAAGIWQVAIAVNGAEGAGDATFQVEVLPSRTVNVWLLAGGALMVVVVLGFVGVVRRRRLTTKED